ncbi:MAG: cell division protein FtsA [Treponema sp.]|nr:cell division protein FtsA [Treponema sp.]
MADEKIVGLDIGTNTIRVAIGEIDPETGAVQIAGTASRKSAGLRNGVIVNIEDAKNAIKEAIDAAEQNAGCAVESVITAIGGSPVESINSKGLVPVSNNGKSIKEISRSDVERVIDCAIAVKVPDDKEKLHVIPQNYIVDGVGGITDPIHRMGTRLEAEVHIVTAAKTIIQNLRSTISRADYILDGVMLKTLAQTQSVCHQDELELGSILIDLGAGSTDVLILFHGAPIATASVPVGGNLVTNDIALVTGISVAAAEEIKVKHGCCWLKNITAENDSEVILPGVGGRAPEIMMRSQLCKIIQARVEQIFHMIKAAISKNTNDSIKELFGNIILTGGGAMMDGMIELAQQAFRTSSVRLGIPEKLGGIEEDYRRPDFATVIGLVVANKSLALGRDKRKRSKSHAAKRDKSKSGDSVLKKIFKSLF